MPRPLRGQNDNTEKREGAAFLIPFFGVVLLVPPFLNLFVVEELYFGAPLTVIYLFTVWIALILGAVALSRQSAFRAEPPDARAPHAGSDPARPSWER